VPDNPAMAPICPPGAHR